MALIVCPECGREISDKAKQCVQCGYPIEELYSHPTSKGSGFRHENETNRCLIDGVVYDLTETKRILLSLPAGKLERKEDKDRLAKVQDELCHTIDGFSIFASIILTNEIRSTGIVPASFNADQYAVKFKEDDGLVHCPRCDSTQIVTGQRGYSLMWGFLGSNKTMNRCANCGHKWEPSRW